MRGEPLVENEADDPGGELFGAHGRPGEEVPLAVMRAGKQPFLVAEGTVPINLAITGVTGSRFPADRQIALNITADSLPLDLVPTVFSNYVSNLTGRVSSSFMVGGSLNHPRLTGQFSLHEGQAHVVPAGITLNQIEASIRMLGDTVVIDSIAASNKGRILLTGGIGLKSLAAPSFDRLVLLIVLGLVAIIGLGVLRGDQVGVRPARFGPIGEARR